MLPISIHYLSFQWCWQLDMLSWKERNSECEDPSLMWSSDPHVIKWPHGIKWAHVINVRERIQVLKMKFQVPDPGRPSKIPSWLTSKSPPLVLAESGYAELKRNELRMWGLKSEFPLCPSPVIWLSMNYWDTHLNYWNAYFNIYLK